MAEPDRDRDPAGRARSARPRDATGRPLPRGSVGVPRPPDDLVLAPAAAIDEAQRLLDEGSPFTAHEILEGAWKAAPAAERSLWQGLAQVAVGLTHLQRGNRTGAAALLRRGAERIEPYAARSPYGLDVTGIYGYAQRVAVSVAADDPPGAAPPTLRLRGTTSRPPGPG